MKNQIVYVVTDKASDTIVGVFNEYKVAEDVAFKWQEVKDSREEEVAITPVAVDVSVDVPNCYTFEDLEQTLKNVFEAVQRSEFESLDEDEDEDEDDEEEECYTLTPKGEFFLGLLNNNVDPDEALAIVNILFRDGYHMNGE